MRNVCDDCKWQKKRFGGECVCIKYGIPMYTGRVYCIAYDRKEGNREKDDTSEFVKIPEQKDRD